jgi:hypothetical protein
MRNPKVLSIADIKGGKPYICIRSYTDCSIDMEVRTFLGVPRKDLCSYWWIRTSRYAQKKWRSNGSITYSGWEPTSNLGLDTAYRSENEHRVFEFNTDNLTLLRKIVAEQDIRGYLTLIGISDPDKTIERNAKDELEAQQLMDDLNYDFDVYPEDFSIVESYGLR